MTSAQEHERYLRTHPGGVLDEDAVQHHVEDVRKYPWTHWEDGSTILNLAATIRHLRKEPNDAT